MLILNEKILSLGVFFVLLASMVFAAGENSVGRASTDAGSPEFTDAHGGGSDMSNRTPEETGQGNLIATSTETAQQNSGEATQIKNEVKTQEKL